MKNYFCNLISVSFKIKKNIQVWFVKDSLYLNTMFKQKDQGHLGFSDY